MSNLMDIQSQIEKLQKQASDIKSKEFDKTVQEILAKMHAFGITTKHLQSAGVRGKQKATVAGKRIAKKKALKARPSPVAPKFRGPGGETWSGRGLTPRWLASLIAQGKI